MVIDKKDPKEGADDADLRISLWWLIIPIILVVSIWLFTPYIIQKFYINNIQAVSTVIAKDVISGDEDKEYSVQPLNVIKKSSYEAQGQFGDQYGYINALFSGLAFSVLIFTMYLQRVELAATRSVLKLQQKEFAKQNETLSVQRFENSFYKHLENLSRVCAGLNGNINDGKDRPRYMGNDLLNVLVQVVHNAIAPDVFSKSSTAPREFATNIISRLQDIWDGGAARIIDSYLDFVYLILKQIHNSSALNKIDYIRILRANLSYDELEAIYLFAIVRPDKGLLRILNQYNFFDEVFENFQVKTREFKGHYNNLVSY